jgi:short-subunit dehydrogenase
MNVLVLGASSEIGSQLAAAFAPGNAVLLAGREETKLSHAGRLCTAAGATRVTQLVSDLRTELAPLVHEAIAWEPDLIINAACSTSRLRDREIPVGALGACIATDLLAPVELVRSVLAARRGRNVGVIFVSTILAQISSPRRQVYSSLKVLHEWALKELAATDASMRVLVVRVATIFPVDRPSRQAQHMAKAVRQAFERGKQVISFGASGRVLRWLYYAQPLIFRVVMEAQSRLRHPSVRRPAAAAGSRLRGEGSFQ